MKPKNKCPLISQSVSVCHSVVSDSFVTPWTVAHQAPLSMGILQVRILEWIAIPFSRGSSQPRDQTQVSCIAGGFFTIWATREASVMLINPFLPQWSKLCFNFLIYSIVHIHAHLLCYLSLPSICPKLPLSGAISNPLILKSHRLNYFVVLVIHIPYHIQLTHLMYTMAFSIFRVVQTSPQSVLEHFHHPNKKPCMYQQSLFTPPSSPPTQSQETNDLFCVYIDLLILEILYQYNPTICDPLWLASFM